MSFSLKSIDDPKLWIDDADADVYVLWWQIKTSEINFKENVKFGVHEVWYELFWKNYGASLLQAWARLASGNVFPGRDGKERDGKREREWLKTVLSKNEMNED